MLNTTQQATLKVFIEANPTWMAYVHNTDGAFAIAEELQNESTTVVWRTNVTESEITNNISDEATSWDWTEFIGRNAGEQRGYERMFRTGTIDVSKPNVRQGFIDIFSGPGGADQRTHMAAISKRFANLLEELFATGTGTIVSPSTMEIEGNISYREIARIMGW